MLFSCKTKINFNCVYTMQEFSFRIAELVIRQFLDYIVAFSLLKPMWIVLVHAPVFRVAVENHRHK